MRGSSVSAAVPVSARSISELMGVHSCWAQALARRGGLCWSICVGARRKAERSAELTCILTLSLPLRRLSARHVAPSPCRHVPRRLEPNVRGRPTPLQCTASAQMPLASLSSEAAAGAGDLVLIPAWAPAEQPEALGRKAANEQEYEEDASDADGETTPAPWDSPASSSTAAEPAHGPSAPAQLELSAHAAHPPPPPPAPAPASPPYRSQTVRLPPSAGSEPQPVPSVCPVASRAALHTDLLAQLHAASGSSERAGMMAGVNDGRGARVLRTREGQCIAMPAGETGGGAALSCYF